MKRNEDKSKVFKLSFFRDLMEQEKKSIFKSLGTFYHKCVRVFKVARKPNSMEVKQVSKVSALGILAIGMIGFLIGLGFTIFFL